MSLKELLLQDNLNCTIKSPASIISIESTVIKYRAVIAQNRKLTNKGDYIQLLLRGTVSIILVQIDTLMMNYMYKYCMEFCSHAASLFLIHVIKNFVWLDCLK